MMDEEHVDNLIDDLRLAIDDIEGDISVIDEYLSWLDQTEDEWESRDSSVVNAFQESAQSILDGIDETEVNWQEFKSVSESIQNAYRQPLLESVQQHILDICDLFSVEECPVDTEYEYLETHYDKELSEVREEFEELKEDLDSTSNTVITILSDRYNRSPSLLLDPVNVKADVNSQTDLLDSLEQLSELFSTVSWAPDVYETLKTELPEFSEGDIDVEEIGNLVDQVEERKSQFEEFDIDIDDAIKNELSDQYTSGEIHSPLVHVSDELSVIQEYESTLENTSELLTEFGKPNETEELEDRFQTITGTEYQDIDNLKRDLISLNRSFENWTRVLTEKWLQIRPFAEYYNREIVDETPERVKKILDEGLDIEDSPIDSYEIVQEIDSWVVEQEEELEARFSDEAVGLIRKLIDQESVRVDDTSSNAIKQVNNELPLIIKIDEE